jgi:hypothetical protein
VLTSAKSSKRDDLSFSSAGGVEADEDEISKFCEVEGKFKDFSSVGVFSEDE